MKPFALIFAAAAIVLQVGVGPILAEEPALTLRATVVGAATDASLAIELLRWSTETERAPLVAALAAPPPPSAPAGPVAAGGPAAGRGGRGGRGAAPPASPAVRLGAAIKAAPTVGFIWGAGPTGYSIKYAWHAALPDGQDRVILVTDRRLGAHATTWPGGSVAAADADFAVIEMRLDGRGAGEGKSSLTTTVIFDPATRTLALEGYDVTPVLLKVTR